MVTEISTWGGKRTKPQKDIPAGKISTPEEFKPVTLADVQGLDKEWEQTNQRLLELRQSYIDKGFTELDEIPQEARAEVESFTEQLQALTERYKTIGEVQQPTLEERGRRQDLEVAISKLYPDMLTVYEGETATLEDKYSQVITRMGEVATTNPAEFVKEITQRGDRNSAEAVFRNVYEIDDEAGFQAWLDDMYEPQPVRELYDWGYINPETKKWVSEEEVTDEQRASWVRTPQIKANIKRYLYDWGYENPDTGAWVNESVASDEQKKDWIRRPIPKATGETIPTTAEPPKVPTTKEVNSKKEANSEPALGTWREYEGVTYAPGVSVPVTFWENPVEWWKQQGEHGPDVALERQAAAIRRESLANTPGIIGMVNSPLWQGGLSSADIVAIGLLTYVGYQSAQVGWDFFLRSSLIRNLNSWSKSAGIEIDAETKNNFVNTMMANLSKKWLSQQAIRTLFRPTKAGLQVPETVVREANQEVYALVQAQAPAFVPKGTQTGAMAYGGLGKPAGILKKLPTLAQTEILKAAQAQATKVGLDLEAVEGISEGEYWVSLTTSRKNKEAFTDWLVKLRNENPEKANQVEKSLVGKFEFKETEPAYGRGRFLPFKNIEDAQKFVQTGDMSLVAKKIELHGKPLTPEQRAAQLAEQVKAKLAAEIKPEVEAVKKQAPQVTSEIETVISDIQSEISKTSAELKGKRGEEARVSRLAVKGLERELDYAQKTLDAFKSQVNVPDAGKLRQTIMAFAKFKGLPKTQLQKIIHDVAGKRRLTSVASPQLTDILERVREARPVRIKATKVVTLKTEKKIQTLKENLIASRQLTEQVYDKIKERLGLTTDKYETARKFISESEAKELIRAMNDEVPLAEWDIKVEDALAKSPAIKEARDKLNDRGMIGTGVEFDGKPIVIGRGQEFRSMRYYMLNLQKKLKAPIYDAWQKINQAHLVARDRHNEQMNRLYKTTPNFKEVVSSEESLKKIEDYIASKQNLAKIKAPELTDDELAIATELERGYFEAQNDVRFIRFTNAYAENEGDIDLIAKEIPNAPKRALRRAIDIYEGKGANELRKFTDTQKWGVIGSGYDPRSFIKPILYLRAPKETTFAKGLLRTRSGVEYQGDDTNIIQRYSRHQKQIIALQELSARVRAFGRLYAENANKLDTQSQRNVSRVLSRGINEQKGYREDAGAIVHFIERLYGQVASAVFWRPDLVMRNKFQNFAFNPDYWAGRFLDPRNKPLSESRRRWFEVFVSQERAFEFEFLLQGEKALPGLGRITRLARKTSLYPWSDKSNRTEAFYTRINRVDRALAQYEKDGNLEKLIKDSGLNELEPRQQAEALELLAMDSVDYGIADMKPVSGKEAFALYNAQQLVNNVHFLYDRAQRAPAEMGTTGRTLGNILVFSRSWGERILLQSQKLDPKVKMPSAERMKAFGIVMGIITAGLLAGAAYKKVTGKDHNPYNPLNIFTWTPGGLAIGVTEDISNGIYLITQAVQGDKSALASLPGVFSNVATLVLPFYKNAVQALDAVTDMKNVDVYVMRKIRELIDEEYEVRGGTHEVDRTLLEYLQRAFFSMKDKPETPQEKLEDIEPQLGTVIEEEGKPFTLEEPDIFNMGKLNSEMSRILKNVKPEEVTKENDYSDLAVAWVDKEQYKAIMETMPNKKLYEITELPEELEKWAGRHKRELSLITKYQKLETKAEREAFLEEHPELRLNPTIEYLKQFPLANARLALWGQAKIYTKEAYNEFVRLVKELDIPDDAISPLLGEKSPFFQLPEKSVDNYLALQDVVSKPGMAWNSWEAQIIYAKDDKLREFLGYDPVETPIASLEIKTEPQYREIYNKLQDRDYLDTLDDTKKDESGLTERGRYIKELKDTKIGDVTYYDIDNKITAIEKGTEDNPIPDETVNAFIDYKRIGYEGGTNSGIKSDLARYDDDALNDFLMNKDYWGEDALQPLHEDKNYLDNYLVPRWRIETDEAYETKDAEYNAIKNDLPAEQARLRAEWLAKPENAQYRQDSRKIEAYELSNSVTGYRFPTEQVENYVAYYEIPDIPESKRHDRFLIENPIFAQAMLDSAKLADLPKAEDVPSVEYDNIYDQFPDQFDELYGLGKPEAFNGKYYIRDSDAREARSDELKFKYVTQNYSGVSIANKQLTEFGEAWYGREAYEKFIPDSFVEEYVGWKKVERSGKPEDWEGKSGTDYWFEDDWYLLEHYEFYKQIYKNMLGLDKRPIAKAPSREVFKKYIGLYLPAGKGKDREDVRWNNLDLDSWLVLYENLVPIEEQMRRAEYTPAERQAQSIRGMEERLRERPKTPERITRR